MHGFPYSASNAKNLSDPMRYQRVNEEQYQLIPFFLQGNSFTFWQGEIPAVLQSPAISVGFTPLKSIGITLAH